MNSCRWTSHPHQSSIVIVAVCLAESEISKGFGRWKDFRHIVDAGELEIYPLKEKVIKSANDRNGERECSCIQTSLGTTQSIGNKSIKRWKGKCEEEEESRCWCQSYRKGRARETCVLCCCRGVTVRVLFSICALPFCVIRNSAIEFLW